MNTKIYNSPFGKRYGSKEMLYNFSPKKKYSTWRKLWLSLAEAQKQLGLNISEKQIKELKNNLYNINFERVSYYEKKFHHDVMAHIYALGEICPLSRPIIHLGATSAFVKDNTELIQIRDGMEILLKKIINIIRNFKKFCIKYKNTPTLGFTHYQPAQVTTVGKRATLWLQSLLLDLKTLNFRLKNLPFRGVKGAIGTAESFKKLFNGDFKKIQKLEKIICKNFNFKKVFSVTGQTYDRKIDSQILNLLSGIAQSAHKFTNDLRLLQNLKEIEEDFEKEQIGSSIMAYKRNPIKSERIASLSKYVISLENSSAIVSATQWLERTLDDSANKRLVLSQSFICVDYILLIWNNILNGLRVNTKIINKNLKNELPFMITEFILSEIVKNGGDRQKIHERIRIHSMNTFKKNIINGKKNDFIKRILNDKEIPIDKKKIYTLLKPKNLKGFAREQTSEFLKKEVNPILKKYSYIKNIDY